MAWFLMALQLRRRLFMSPQTVAFVRRYYQTANQATLFALLLPLRKPVIANN